MGFVSKIETSFLPFLNRVRMRWGKYAEDGTTFKPRHSVPPGLCMDSPSPMDPQKAEET